MSWYVLSCKAGQEDETIRTCKERLSGETLEDAFCLSCDRMKKYLGEWHTDTCRPFPGTVFLQSSHPECLRAEENSIMKPVSPADEQTIRQLFTERRGECFHMGLSKFQIQTSDPLAKNERTGQSYQILSGPLLGQESRISRLNLHKRVAVLCVRLLGQEQELWAGIELQS